MQFKSILFFTFVSSLVFSVHAKIVKESYIITDQRQNVFELLKSRPELTIDHIHLDSHYELYGPDGTGEFLIKNKIDYKNVPNFKRSIVADYPKFIEVENFLKTINKKFPKITKLYSIGKSGQGRNLYVIKIAKNVEIDDQRPRVKLIANMHGDEITGREVMLRLIHFLTNEYQRNSQVTDLIDNLQIHIMPSMNPDGAEVQRRGNGNYVDLNRDFPDFSTSDNQNTSMNREPETKAVMDWQRKQQFNLSANFHGGAEVVNYPWDTTDVKHPKENLLKDLSLEYAMNAKYIGSSTVFQNGITNGYQWYEVNGGMQDWSIYYEKDLQLTIELSDEKWPEYSLMDRYFHDNRDALLDFLARAKKL